MTAVDDYEPQAPEFSDPDVQLTFELTRNWPPEQRAGILRQLEAAQAREKVRTRYAHPAELAMTIDPEFNLTPALLVISTAIEALLNTPPGARRNLLITCPPQEGKSTMAAVYTVLRALQLDPNRRIILACYGDSLAHGHSRKCRDLINTHGSGVTDSLTGVEMEDKIGLKLAYGANKVSEWSIEGGDGGLVAAGMGATLTGKPADLFIIDDPYKNATEADSKSYREKVDLWFASVVQTRLSASAPMILIQTRWHPEDLSGKVIAGEAALPRKLRTWRHINIPAISEEGVPDALNRPPGEALVSARGRTQAQFEATRRAVGERVWYALYQGMPKNPSGGLFLRTWFDNTRRAVAPDYPLAAVVGIDPADSGEGDETGIVGGVLDQEGAVVFTEDWSAQLTSDQWARQAVILALKIGAREIAMEAFATATTYVRVIKEAWRAIHAEAIEKYNSGAELTAVETAALAPDMPFHIRKWTAKGDAEGRSSALRQGVETGKAVTLENKLAVFEQQACDWQSGQHQPDRVAAGVIVYDRLRDLLGNATTMAPPVNTGPKTQTPAWLKRSVNRGRGR